MVIKVIPCKKDSTLSMIHLFFYSYYQSGNGITWIENKNRIPTFGSTKWCTSQSFNQVTYEIFKFLLQMVCNYKEHG